jgi:hypothetical protein
VSDGDKTIDNINTSYGASYAAGVIIGVALDLDAGTPTVTFYKNNATQGAISLPATLTSQKYVLPAIVAASYGDTYQYVNFGQDSSFAGQKTAQGNQDINDKGDFYYAPPAGFLALCNDNLPTASIALPTDHFNTITWTGDGTSSRSFTGVGFTPDLIWAKNRGVGVSHMLYDTVRGTGATKSLESNVALAEGGGNQATYGYLSAFSSDGFTTTDGSGSPNYYFNQSSQPFVAWNWKAGGAASANTDGSITSSVSANPTAGFSIVSYTGTGTTAQTVGHGLSIAPEMMIIKSRSIQQVWNVFHSPGSVTGNTVLDLSTADASNTGGNIEIVANASTFGIGSATQVNTSTATFIAYCFNSIEGYSKAGLYVGNGNTDGPFIYTGFRPSWILVKNKTASAYWWIIDSTRDPYNVAYHLLYPNGSNTEAVANYTPIDILSNGWKSRIPGGNGNEGTFNTSGQTYIYYAIAESPFKTSNAR